MMILVTGGAGYIGAHTVLVLLEAGFDVVVVDNLANSSPKSLRRVSEITGKSPQFIQADIRDTPQLTRIFETYPIRQVLHFAGLKAVGESTEQPLSYYDNNLAGTLSLLRAMSTANVKQIVFSSSATVYGDSHLPPYKEAFGRGTTTNPYGTSKAMIEQVLEDLVASDPSWSVALLRYFNPVGAHQSGKIGEDPKGIPNNLMPFITQVAVGKRPALCIYGNDYDTLDGTCLRDYIHVMDLAEGHIAALQSLKPGCQAFNLGAGVPVSVLEMVKAFEAENQLVLPHMFVERRAGDMAAVWADTAKATNILKWQAKRDLADMVRSSWNWQVNNPHGYE